MSVISRPNEEFINEMEGVQVEGEEEEGEDIIEEELSVSEED